MNATLNRTVLALGIALALAASGASATNGYYTHGAGTKSKGQAGAGSANPEELMILATNPAGLTALPESIDAGLGIFMPFRDYETSASLAQGNCAPPGGPANCAFTIGPNDLASDNEFFPIPFVAMNWNLTDVDFLAAAFYARGGMNTKWEGGTASFDPDTVPSGAITLSGTYGDNTAGVDLMQAFLNLSYARKLSDQFSVGGSLILAMQRFEARGVDTFAPYTKTFVQSLFTTGLPAPAKNLSDNGHDLSYGYGGTLGMMWRPVDAFSLAASYTTKMTMSDFSNYSDLFAGGGSFDMPSTWTIGVAFRPTEAVTLVFDVQDISYSDVDAVANPIQNLFNCPLFNPGGDFESCLGGNKGAGFGWEDMTVYKLGASWQYSDTWTWRVGYSLTDQPIPKDQMTFNILAPGVVEDHLTFGFTQDMANGNELNLSFMYAPTTEVKGLNNFDPSQTVKLEMNQIELELSYSWKR
jgi:long-chain fatty acid transport protein